MKQVLYLEHLNSNTALHLQKAKHQQAKIDALLLFVHTLVDVAVYQLYRAVWKLESYSVLETFGQCDDLVVLVIECVLLLEICIYRNMFLFGRGLVVVHICSQLIYNYWYSE